MKTRARRKKKRKKEADVMMFGTGLTVHPCPGEKEGGGFTGEQQPMVLDFVCVCVYMRACVS